MNEENQTAKEVVETPTPEAPQQPPVAPAPVVAPVSGWSWGAFMFDPIFLIAIKRYAMLLWYLLMLIPLVNFIFMIGIKLYLGVKGSEMAVRSKMFNSEAELAGFMKAFDHAGKVVFIFTLVMMGLFLLVGILGFALIFEHMSDLESVYY